MSEAELLPEGSLLLHVGPSKTGSTAIQVAFDAVRDQLGQHGVAYPTQFRRLLKPGWAVIGWAPPGNPVPDIDTWHRFCKRVARVQADRICVSTEDFGQVSTPELARTIVEGLGGERVHVLSVARPYHRLLPSYWQEIVRTNFDTRTYEQWLHDVLDTAPDDGHGWAFTSSHNVTRTVPAWLGAIDPSRYTLVVLDETDRSMLPRVFEQMLGLPEHLLEVGGATNASLSLNAIEVLRRLNELKVERDWPAEIYVKLARHGFIRGALAGTPGPAERSLPELPVWAVEPITRLCAARVEEVRSLGVRVIGDPDDLLAPSIAPAGPEAYDVQAISLDVAVSALAETFAVAIDREQRAVALAGEVDAPSPDVAPEPAAGTTGLAHRVRDRIGRRPGR